MPYDLYNYLFDDPMINWHYLINLDDKNNMQQTKYKYQQVQLKHDI